MIGAQPHDPAITKAAARQRSPSLCCDRPEGQIQDNPSAIGKITDDADLIGGHVGAAHLRTLRHLAAHLTGQARIMSPSDTADHDTGLSLRGIAASIADNFSPTAVRLYLLYKVGRKPGEDDEERDGVGFIVDVGM
jgi:hypothetical protein